MVRAPYLSIWSEHLVQYLYTECLDYIELTLAYHWGYILHQNTLNT